MALVVRDVLYFHYFCTMKLHIFNPEHDMALAANKDCFTSPHAGRQLRADLGFIPALWADDADLVLVDDVEAAAEAVRHVRKYAHDVRFVSIGDLAAVDFSGACQFKVEPWGWDAAIRHQLLKANASLGRFLPTRAAIDGMREVSSRKFAAEQVLPRLCSVGDGLVGESRYCSTLAEALEQMKRNGRSVLKSPWSSSGRGVRYVEAAGPTEHLLGWMRNIVNVQGGIMVEPLYNKVMDFGVELYAHADGTVHYCGLSVFETRNGAYSGSVLATEEDKRAMLSRLVNLSLLDAVKDRLCGELSTRLAGVYEGPLGVDMMAVAGTDGDGCLLHPCVELNLRRTMGHVALALTPTERDPQRVMSIGYTDKYHMRIQTLTVNLLDTGLV